MWREHASSPSRRRTAISASSPSSPPSHPGRHRRARRVVLHERIAPCSAPRRGRGRARRRCDDHRRMRGTLDEHVIESEALRGNPLGDPHVRPLWVYTPPRYAGGPAVYVLRASPAGSRCAESRRPSATFIELLDDADIDARVVWSTPGRRSAARSSSIRTGAAATTPTSARRSSRSSTNERDERLPRRRRQVERRPGRRGDGDAPARSLPRLARATPAAASSRSIQPSSGCGRRLRDVYGGSTIERFLDELRTGPAPLAHPHDRTSCSSGASRPPTRQTTTGRSTFRRSRDRRGDPGALGAVARRRLPGRSSRATPMLCAGCARSRRARHPPTSGT